MARIPYFATHRDTLLIAQRENERVRYVEMLSAPHTIVCACGAGCDDTACTKQELGDQ